MSDAAAEALPETVVLALDPAVEYQGRTFSELRLRRPTYGEMVEHDKRGGGGDGVLYLVALMSEVPAQALMKADAAVMLEAGEVIADFLAVRQRRRPNGATSSPR